MKSNKYKGRSNNGFVLSNYARIRRFMCRENKINGTSYDDLHRLYSLVHFTVKDIRNHYVKDALIEGEWITMFSEGARGGTTFDHDKFKLTMKAVRMIKKTYDYVLNPDKLPKGVIKELKIPIITAKKKRLMKRKRKYRKNDKSD